MADDVTFGAGNNATPPDLTIAATDETTSGPHAAGAQMGIAKLAVSANGDSTHVPATAADGLLVNLGANNDVTVSGTVSVTEPVSVDDNGGSLTVDGPLTDAELRAAAVPVSGTVSVNEPVSVDDNGGSLTVDNPVLSVVGGGVEATAQRVTIANDSTGVLSVDDNGGSLTVDGTVTANQGAAGTAWEIVGDVAADAAVPANPVAVGGRSSDALPTEVSADGESVYFWLLRNGALMSAQLPHLGLLGDPYTITSETAQYTTTQTSTALVTPGGGQRIAVTSIQIQAGGTTAGALQVYFGDGAYSRGTSLAIFDGEFAPSATLKPGFALAPYKPWIGGADEELRVTDSAAINPLTVTVWYYLI